MDRDKDVEGSNSSRVGKCCFPTMALCGSCRVSLKRLMNVMPVLPIR